MNTVHPFDELTKVLASGRLERRNALFTIGSAFLGAIFGSLGSTSFAKTTKPPKRTSKECASFCATFPKGKDQAACKKTCLACPPTIPLCGTTVETLTCCSSLVCVANVCHPPSCFDGVKNQDETDVDCGGATCVACGSLKACKVGSDCSSGHCNGGVCT